ncbi:unnamed protein product, partial [Rotaria sp. Silwood2]
DAFDDEQLSIPLTRVYVILLATGVSILTFYSLLTVHNLAITVTKPSLDTFERLYSAYPLSVSCPCSKVAIPLREMVITSPVRYHQ